MRSTRLAVAAVLLVGLAMAGCKTTTTGDTTNTGAVTGYEFGNQDAYWEQRRDRPDYRDFE